MDKRELRILMAEDSPSDAELARAAFKGTGLKTELTIVSDGVEAIEYMKGVGKYSERLEPDLVILDLNMPRKDGREVLEELKKSEEFKKIPVVILTTSSDEVDVTRCYQSFASCFITKPNDFEDFVGVTKAIRDFYFSVVTLPTLTNTSGGGG